MNVGFVSLGCSKNLLDTEMTIGLFKNNNYDMDYKVNYGMNYFPIKKYDGATYKEGNYESLVVSIGEAKGNNYWCILYPPLCMIDNKKEVKNKIEYKFKIIEYIKKLL